MNLNNLGTGKQLVDSVIKNSSVRKMGWSRQQQDENRNKQPNPRKGNK